MRALVPAAVVVLMLASLATAQESRDSANDDLVWGRHNALVRAAQKAGPSVVTVSVLRTQLVEGPALGPNGDFFSPFFQNLRRRYLQRVQALGSGVIVRKDGTILTNFHVVNGAEKIKITLADGREYEGRFLGGTQLYDVAVLRADVGKDDVPVATLDKSGELEIGEWVMAIGNPFGYLLGDTQPTVTAGVVSAIRRDIHSEGTQDTLYKNMIQTDAAINPGNSGGPLVDAVGDVVGINTFIFSQSGGSVGIGFAIPIGTASRVMDEILAHGTVREVWVGVRVQEIPESLAESLDLESREGVIVASVDPGSPAEKAGVRRGDVIHSIGGERIRNFDDARRALYARLVGDRIDVVLERDGAQSTRTLVLTEQK
ncbi:MAG: trypsin-like peptidase domain-containing protein [bacterium]